MKVQTVILRRPQLGGLLSRIRLAGFAASVHGSTGFLGAGYSLDRVDLY